MSLFAFLFLVASVLALAIPGTRLAGLLGLALLVWAYPLIALLLLATAGAVVYFRHYRRRTNCARREHL
jgi:hypothetical protein